MFSNIYMYVIKNIIIEKLKLCKAWRNKGNSTFHILIKSGGMGSRKQNIFWGGLILLPRPKY